MHSVSSLYRQILAMPHDVETVIQVGGTDVPGVKTTIPGTVYGGDVLESVKIGADLISSNEAPAIGNFIARKIEIKMLIPDSPIGAMTRIVPYCRIVSGGQKSEWIPKGVYFVDTKRQNMTEVGAVDISIIGYDAAVMANTDYGATMAFPAADSAVVADIANRIGVTVDLSAINQGYTITTKPDEMTMTETMGAIAAMYGGNFTIDDCGVLRLIQLQKTGTAQEFSHGTLQLGVETAAYTGAVLHDGEGTKYTSGSGRMLNAETPWAQQAAADYVKSIINGYKYVGFRANNVLSHPAVELADLVTFGGKTELLMNYTIDCSGFICTMGAPAEKEINHEAPFRSAAARGVSGARSAGRAVAKTKQDLETKILTEHNQLVAALNGEDGAPVDLASGLSNYVQWDLENNEGFATSRLFSEIGDKAKSEIETYTFVDANGNTQSIASIGVTAGEAKAGLTLKADQSTVNGISQSVATLQADVINLQGRVDVTGTLSVENGGVRVHGGLVAASLNSESSSMVLHGNTFSVGGNCGLGSSGITLGSTSFTPTQITSTTGSVTVLGY